MGAALLVAATFLPVNGGGRAGYPYAIYDKSVQKELLLFSLEPLGVAVATMLAVAFLLRRYGKVTGGILLGFGFQTAFLFLAHFGIATFGNPEYNSFRPGSLVGGAGAAFLLLAGGLALLRSTSGRRPSGNVTGAP